MFDNIKQDLEALGGGRCGLRTLVRGLLSQGLQAIVVYRFFHWLRQKNIPVQPVRFMCERFIEITTGISIPAECKIGKGFRIHHFGGIIFHPAVIIGKNCTIYQGVTLGDRGGYGGAPTIGDNVIIGAGAKIVGEVTIGNNCKIGALAVVSESIPDNAKVYCARPIVMTADKKRKK
ncbi:MAG: serine acetyltransferase [Desulfotalea sp.]|nr:MAG: serine acetyltransferase [Desulfotalea sp.]